MEWIKLIGIVIIILGFILKFDTIATVVVAGLVTALVSGISFIEFLTILGEAFTNQRFVTLFFLTLPMIGLSETFGLKEQAIRFIEKIKGLSTGGLFTVYQAIRELSGFFSIRLGGHPQFVRPLIYPMAEAAAESDTDDKLDEDDVEKIKARASAADNYGNFFAQNTFAGSAGIQLISATLIDLGLNGNQSSLAIASIPIAVIALVLAAIFNWRFDRQLRKKAKAKK
ncbi:DUF969 domain-containing protein [Ruoffia sp. FAM 24228]|uniref:DUF969 domain-containing protein n=1 Tax=Ruoffia sp. FAM 24228 TaxID=3259517 RepID=UPI00388497B7